MAEAPANPVKKKSYYQVAPKTQQDKCCNFKAKTPKKAQSKKAGLLQEEIAGKGQYQEDEEESIQLKPLKKYQWEEIGQLQKKLVRQVDKDIYSVKEFVKPQAQSIYYDRKVELLDVLHAKKRADKSSMEEIERELQRKKQENSDIFQETRDEITQIMEKYDIKHPMRGEEFADYGVQTQTFQHKILGEAQAESSFLNYKYDQRKAMDFSAIRSEKYIKAEKAKYNLHKMLMRYRIFGQDGINDREFQKLLAMGIIYKDSEKRIKTKKKVKRWAFNQSTAVKTEWESDMSGSGSDTYDYKIVPIYFDNGKGDYFERNEGFAIEPLCPEIFGEKAAKTSKVKHKKNEEKAKEKKKRGRERSDTQDSYGDVSFMNEASFFNEEPIKEEAASRRGGGTSRGELTQKQLKKNPFSSQMQVAKESVDMMAQTYTPDEKAKQAMRKHRLNNEGKNLTSTNFKTQRLQDGLTPQTFQRNLMNQTNQNFDIDYNVGSMLDTNLPSIRNSKQGPANKILMPHLAKKLLMQRKRKRFNSIEAGDHTIMKERSVAGGSAVEEVESAAGNILAGASGTHTPISTVRMKEKPFPSLAIMHSKGSTGRIMKNDRTFPTNPPYYNNYNQSQQDNYVDEYDEYIIDKQTGHKYKFQNDSQTSFQTQQFRKKYPFRHRSQMTNYENDAYSNNEKISQRTNLKLIAQAQDASSRNHEAGRTMSLLSKHTRKVAEDNRGKRGSPFRFQATQKNLTANTKLARKKLGVEAKKSFMVPVPTIRDQDIKALIFKYPVRTPDEEDEPAKKEYPSKYPSAQSAGDQPGGAAANNVPEPNSTEGSVLKGKLELLTRVINQTLIQSKADAQDALAKQVLNSFRHDELQRISETFKEIDFAEVAQFPTMYYYKTKDADEKLQVAQEVTQEFKEGKLDPNKRSYM